MLWRGIEVLKSLQRSKDEREMDDEEERIALRETELREAEMMRERGRDDEREVSAD